MDEYSTQGYKEIYDLLDEFEKKIKELDVKEEITKRGRKKNSPNLSREQLKFIWTLTKEGLFRPDIAKQVTEIFMKTKIGSTCSRQTVYNWQKKFGLI